MDKEEGKKKQFISLILKYYWYNTDSTLTDWYANVISSRKEALCTISNILVADAWFSKKKFVDQIVSAGMHLISRLGDTADLMYMYKGKSTGNCKPFKS